MAAYSAGNAAPLLDWLYEDGLQQEAGELRSAIAGLALFEHPRLELAADFATLFLSDARNSAAPAMSPSGAALWRSGWRTPASPCPPTLTSPPII